MMCLCCSCQYLGDKFSFPPPNDLPLVDKLNPRLKRYFCCCGDSDLYGLDITGRKINSCQYFEEL